MNESEVQVRQMIREGVTALLADPRAKSDTKYCEQQIEACVRWIRMVLRGFFFDCADESWNKWQVRQAVVARELLFRPDGEIAKAWRTALKAEEGGGAT